MAKRLFAFPDPVNEVAARLVATGVVILAALALVTQSPWLLVLLAYGFWARVLTGPTLSPLGQLVTRVVVSWLGWSPRPVPGPPKRFAQGIGATISTLALAAALAGATLAANVLLVLLIGAASLEAFAGYCLGCKIFALLMRAGIIPEAICDDCADISRRSLSHTN